MPIMILLVKIREFLITLVNPVVSCVKPAECLKYSSIAGQKTREPGGWVVSVSYKIGRYPGHIPSEKRATLLRFDTRKSARDFCKGTMTNMRSLYEENY